MVPKFADKGFAHFWTTGLTYRCASVSLLWSVGPFEDDILVQFKPVFVFIMTRVYLYVSISGMYNAECLYYRVLFKWYQSNRNIVRYMFVCSTRILNPNLSNPNHDYFILTITFPAVSINRIFFHFTVHFHKNS